MYRYAQINEDNIVIGDSFLSGEVTADNMIAIPEDLESPLGKEYKDGEFIEVEHEEPEDISINQQDLLEQIALDTSYLVTLQTIEGNDKQ